MSDSVLLYNAVAAPGDTAASKNSYVRRDSQGNINGQGVNGTIGSFNALQLAVASVSTSQTLSTSATLILATGGGTGGITLTLPPAASCAGLHLLITKVDSGVGAVALQANASEQIYTPGAGGGSNTYTGLSAQGKILLLVSNGVGWNGGQLAA